MTTRNFLASLEREILEALPSVVWEPPHAFVHNSKDHKKAHGFVGSGGGWTFDVATSRSSVKGFRRFEGTATRQRSGAEIEMSVRLAVEVYLAAFRDFKKKNAKGSTDGPTHH